MWIILIIIAICVGAYLLVKRAGEPIEDENTKFLKTQQKNSYSEQGKGKTHKDLDFHPNQKIENKGFFDYTKTKSNNSNSIKIAQPSPFSTQFDHKTYRIDYDCAYDFDNYPFEIVGEASYQENIRKFAVLRDGKGCLTEVDVRIVREPHNSYDKNACRVDINGLVVGYFARNNAESWVNLLNRMNISDSSEIYAKAVIVGGGSKDYKFGVRLDIPSRVANAAKYIKEV